MITKQEIKFLKELSYHETLTDMVYINLKNKELTLFFKLYKDKTSILFEMYPNCKVWKHPRTGQWRFYMNNTEDQNYGGKPYEIIQDKIVELTEDESYVRWIHPEQYLALITTERILYLKN